MSSSPSDRPAPPQMAFCHECGIEIRPLMAPDPTCPRCNGQFVEMIEENTASDPREFDAIDDVDDFDFVGAPPGAMPFGFPPSTGGSAPRQDLSSLIQSLLGGVASTQAQRARAARQGESGSGQTQSPSQDDDGRNDYRHAGHTQFGPFGVQWNVQYGANDGRSTNTQHGSGGEQQQGPVPTLSSFLRSAFGPPARQGDPLASPPEEAEQEHEHDDGMGGAGSASDGRFFNHDNRRPDGTTDGSGLREPHFLGADMRRESPANLPPELNGLRDLFASLFGGNLEGGGMLFDVLSRGPEGGRAQWGDYVFGQQGLDDIISQLMEQTQSSNAPPPAEEDVIAKLERFKLGDEARILKAKNRDCPTCKEDFIPDEPAVSAEDEDEDANANADPPEESVPADAQQEELIAMPCGHIYHEDCLVPWLKLHGTCPVCRVSIVKTRSDQQQQEQQTSQAPPASGSTGSTGSTGNDSGASPGADAREQGAAPMQMPMPMPMPMPGGFPAQLFGWSPMGTRPAQQTAPGHQNQSQSQSRENENRDESAEGMRERARRAAEERQRNAALEPDELD